MTAPLGGIPRDDLTKLEIAEGARSRITATLKDDQDAVIALTDIDTCEVTLYNEDTAVSINSRLDQDIKNTNGGTIHATSGLLTLLLDPLDNVIVATDGRPSEVHIARFKWTYLGVPTNVGFHEVRIAVANLPTIT